MKFSIYETTKSWAENSNLSFQCQPQVDSTNDWAKANAFQEKDSISVYLTDHQNKGRGRATHSWSFERSGDALLLSMSFLLLEAAQPVLSPALGLAVYKAAQSTWLGHPWGLKAPNDLYLGDRKVGGLLLESLAQGQDHRLVVGLGLNVFSHPHVDRSGALIDKILGPEITPEIWHQFLDRLLLEWTSALLQTKSNLDPLTRRGLLKALNDFVDTPDLYSNISERCDLETNQGRVVSWFAL